MVKDSFALQPRMERMKMPSAGHQRFTLKLVRSVGLNTKPDGRNFFMMAEICLRWPKFVSQSFIVSVQD